LRYSEVSLKEKNKTLVKILGRGVATPATPAALTPMMWCDVMTNMSWRLACDWRQIKQCTKDAKTQTASSLGRKSSYYIVVPHNGFPATFRAAADVVFAGVEERIRVHHHKPRGSWPNWDFRSQILSPRPLANALFQILDRPIHSVTVT